ncbi:Uncharacterised protein [Mycobacteroides abscessus subsp. abscessus]|nr:Uncharacterised protein [Mycobacteroides abscessus subsp. abscessus]
MVNSRIMACSVFIRVKKEGSKDRKDSRQLQDRIKQNREQAWSLALSMGQAREQRLAARATRGRMALRNRDSKRQETLTKASAIWNPKSSS